MDSSEERRRDAGPAANDAGPEARIEPAPDIAEEELAEEIDNIVPSRGYEMLPMVGLGGSAGSIARAAGVLRGHAAGRAGLAFVVVLHLSPDHESTLARDAAAVRPRCRCTRCSGRGQGRGQPRLRDSAGQASALGRTATCGCTDLQPERGRRVAVDLFFRTLADTHGPHAAAIVLSGADGDGAIGIKRIKERGGLTIAQDPDEAEHAGMPRAAIDTGMVDWVLPVAEMPRAHRSTIIAHERRLKLPPEDGPQPAAAAAARGATRREAALREILVFLRTRTGRDFSLLQARDDPAPHRAAHAGQRRRRPAGLPRVPAHASRRGRRAAAGPAHLGDEFLPRPRRLRRARRRAFPRSSRARRRTTRCASGCPACATGEEAYSIAMLLLEHARTLDAPPAIQVFATRPRRGGDHAPRARASIREAIAADVSRGAAAPLLRQGAARLPRAARAARDRALRHARSAEGRAVLAHRSRLLPQPAHLPRTATRRSARSTSSISRLQRGRPALPRHLGDGRRKASALFSVVDKKHRIYAPRQARSRRACRCRPARARWRCALELQERNARACHRSRPARCRSRFLRAARMQRARGRARRRARGRAALQAHRALRAAVGHRRPTSTRSCTFREQRRHASCSSRGGEPSDEPAARRASACCAVELRARAFRAATGKRSRSRRRAVPVEIDGVARSGRHLRVAPAERPRARLPARHLRPARASTPRQPSRRAAHRSAVTSDVWSASSSELKSHLRDTVEQYEASTEELKASNEELQAMNEELRSATEELETEPRGAAVDQRGADDGEPGAEEQGRRARPRQQRPAEPDGGDGHRARSSSIATLRIMRFTPTAVPLFNLIPGDVGRPLTRPRSTGSTIPR